jgi:hypothetical protein
MKKTVLAFAFLLFISFFFVVHAQGPGMMGHEMMHSEGENESASGNTMAGAEIFNAHCRVCHANGGNLIDPSMPLKGSGKLSDFKTFLNFIRQPGMPDGSRGAMPSFSRSQISDTHAEELYKFITSEKWALSGVCPKGQDCPHFTQCGKAQTCPQMYPGMMHHQGMMGGYGMGPGMMGGGQQGWNHCPYCGQHLGQYRSGYGMGPGMMRGGYGSPVHPWMGGSQGLMAPGPNVRVETCQKFLDSTADMRKELHQKRFEYFEATRSPGSSPESTAGLEKDIRDLHLKVISQAPHGCL